MNELLSDIKQKRAKLAAAVKKMWIEIANGIENDEMAKNEIRSERERERESTRYRVHISREKNIYLRDFRIVYFLYDSIFLSFYPEWKIMVWKSYLDSFASYSITHTRTHKNRLDIFPEVCNKSLTFNDFRNSTSKFFPWKLSWIQIYLQNRIRPSG